MDCKITKKRISDVLAYDWLKIVMLFIVGIFFWSLLYTTTGVRLSSGQQYQVFFLTPRYNEREMSSLNDRMDKDFFSYDVLDVNCNYYSNDNASMQALSTRIQTGEGDLFFVDNYMKQNDKGEYTTLSSMGSFVDQGVIADLDAYLEGAIAMGERSDKQIEDEFRRRMKRDNRFRNETQRQAGIKLEIKRVRDTARVGKIVQDKILANPKLRVEYQKFEVFNLQQKKEEDKLPMEAKKCYGINLGELKKGAEIVSGEGDLDGKATDLALSVSGFKKQNGELYYEGVFALNYVLETYGEI